MCMTLCLMLQALDHNTEGTGSHLGSAADRKRTHWVSQGAPQHVQTLTVSIYWSLLYSAVLRSWADSLRSHVSLHEWIAFYSVFLKIHWSGVLTALAWQVPQNLLPESRSWRILCTPYNHAPCHFMQSHIRKVYVCLAVTCHLHFWQNDRGLLHATAVTQGLNGYQNKSQHRKLTLEKKILPPLQQGFEPATFRSRVWRSNHWAIPAPQHCLWRLFPESKVHQWITRMIILVLSLTAFLALPLKLVFKLSFF